MVTNNINKAEESVTPSVIDNVANGSNDGNKKSVTVVLRKCPIAPRKLRMIADLIRKKNVERAMAILNCEQKKCCTYIKKLLVSAISIFTKNGLNKIDYSNLFVSIIKVDNGMMLKRLLPAPQGRGYRIRKRTSHITLILTYI